MKQTAEQENTDRLEPDKPAVAACITSAAVLLFGIIKLMHYVLLMEPNTHSSESVGWQNISAFFGVILLGIPPLIGGLTGLLLARSAYARYRKLWFRDDEHHVLISFHFCLMRREC